MGDVDDLGQVRDAADEHQGRDDHAGDDAVGEVVGGHGDDAVESITRVSDLGMRRSVAGRTECQSKVPTET
nr:hypothetical protein DA06_29420 [Georgenia sp. SUBG003]